MPGITDRTSIPVEVDSYYDRVLLENAMPLLVHRNWGQKRNLPANAGTKIIKFRRYGALPVATTPLTEGVTPSGKSLSTTEITATVQQYGDYTTVTDVVDMQSKDPVLTEAGEILGDQAGQTLDELCRDIMCATTNKLYGGSSNTDTDEVADNDDMTTTLLDQAITILQNGKARPITKMVNPDGGYDTTPVAPCFIGIVHANIEHTVTGLTGFVPVEKYANKADVMPGEIGKYKKIRFISTLQGKVYTGAGTGGINVYGTLIFGANAYGDTIIDGNGLKNIRKGFGSSGTADPLDQRATSGWKGTYVAEILNDDYILEIQTSAAFEG